MKEGKQTGHTPGPWRVWSSKDLIQIDAGNASGTNNSAVVHWQGFNSANQPESEKASNARLIAAAPDLLAAAKKTMAYLDDLARSNPCYLARLTLQNYAQWNEAMLELPAAIAKAEGKA